MSTDTLLESSRPRIRRGVAVFAVEGGVMFAAGRLQKKIAGADAQRVLLPVASAMNGEHTIAELAEVLSLPSAVVAQVVTVLHRQGLVEPDRDARAGVVDSPVLDYFAMTAGGSSRFATPAQILAALQDSAVLVVAPQPLSTALVDDLCASGIGSATAVQSIPSLPLQTKLGLVLLAGHHPDAAEFVSACTDGGVAVLRFAVDATAFEVGPLLSPTQPQCWPCFDSGHFPVAPAASGPSGVLQVAAGMVAAQALAYLADLSLVRCEQAFTRTAWPELTSQRFLVACSCGSAAENAQAAQIEAYEDLVVSPAGAERPLSIGRGEGYLALQRMRAKYETSPRVPLPAPGPGPGILTNDWVKPTRSSGLDESVLADLLLRVAGERPAEANGDRRRWTASGGSLGSVELFLISREPVFGAPAGTVFKYDDLRHQLVITMDSVLTGGGAVQLVLVGAVGRQRPKYGDFSLRLAHLDAGCALTQLHAVATGYGLRMAVQDRWPSSLRESLELNEHEQIMAVVQLWPGEG